MIVPTIAGAVVLALAAAVLFQRHRRRRHYSCLVAQMLQAQSL